jgi:hypothetical protein
MVLTLLYVGRREGLGHERTRPARNAGYEPGAREKWMRILFVHPEGNLANNPNLSAIIELLTRAGHEIILRSRRGSFARHKNPNVSVLEVRYRIQRKLMQLSCHPRKWFLGKLLITLVPPMTPPADLVVGVDRQGLIEGAVIARSKGIPLAYWSYEIFFTTECSSNFKALERREASSVRFAVAQDDLRARLLSEETGIPNDRILRIPVAGTGTRPAARTRYLNERFGIPADRRIAIFAGSVDEWTLARPLVESLPLWPENWVLVMHHRYGYVSDWQRSARHRMPSRFYLSEDSLPTIEGLGHTLHGADLGIALYNPTYDTPLCLGNPWSPVPLRSRVDARPLPGLAWMRNYTCRTCKELSRQPLQREIARRRELEADTNLHNTLLHAPSRMPSNVRFLFSAGDRARHGIAGPRSRLQAIAGEPFPGFCDLKSVGGRQQFNFR